MSTARNKAVEEQAGARVKRRSSCKACRGYYSPWDHKAAAARGETCLGMLIRRENYAVFAAELKAKVSAKEAR